MKHATLILLGWLLAATPFVSFAQESKADEAAAVGEDDGTGFSWNAAITSDYVFRGESLSDEKPALQGGVDYNWGNGLYVGTWGSNIDDSDGAPNLEIDTYVGWNRDLSEKWNLDLQLVRYNYFGEASDYGSVAYNEFIAKIAYNEMFTGLFGYSNNYVNSGETSLYYGLNGDFEIGRGFNLSSNVGYYNIDEVGGTVFNYFDYGLGVSRDFGPVNAKLMYIDTFGSDAEFLENLGDGRVVLTLSVGG